MIGSRDCKTTGFKPQDAFTPFLNTSAADDWVLKITATGGKNDADTLASWSLNYDAEPIRPAPSPLNS